MSSERREYRLMIAHVERGVNVEKALVLSRYPDEGLEHLTLRVLAYALLYEEGLTFGSGPAVEDRPDLFASDLTGKIATWITCGPVAARVVRRIVQHNRQAAVHLVFGDPAHREAFTEEVADWGHDRPRGWERLQQWSLDPGLVAALAARPGLRQRWSLTLVGDHVYADADGSHAEGPVTR